MSLGGSTGTKTSLHRGWFSPAICAYPRKPGRRSKLDRLLIDLLREDGSRLDLAGGLIESEVVAVDWLVDELDPDALDPDGSLSPVDQDDRAVEHVPRFRGLNYLTADRGERPRLRTPGLAYLDADADAPSVPTDPDRDRDSEERGGNRGEAESGIRGHAGMIARRADIGHG
jgi:hypothetical protein